MATVTHGQPDQAVGSLKHALDLYEQQNPGAAAELYRQNKGSIRIRIVDDGFAHLSRAQRHDRVWDFLEKHVNDDVLQEISILLLLTHTEQASSFMNFEFEHPVPSGF